MGESYHPLGLTVLEIQDTVKGYDEIDGNVIQKLMASQDFSIMPHSLQMRVLGQVITVSSSLVAEVSGAAVLATNQWVVSIHGDNLEHCVAAFVKYRNAIATQLVTTATGELHSPVGTNTGPLLELANRREASKEKRRSLRENLIAARWSLVSALVGAALGVLGCVFIGG